MNEAIPAPPVDAEFAAQYEADLAILAADRRTAGSRNRPARLVRRVLAEAKVFALVSTGARSVYWLSEQVDGDVPGALEALLADGKIVRLETAVIRGERFPALDVYGVAKESR